MSVDHGLTFATSCSLPFGVRSAGPPLKGVCHRCVYTRDIGRRPSPHDCTLQSASTTLPLVNSALDTRAAGLPCHIHDCRPIIHHTAIIGPLNPSHSDSSHLPIGQWCDAKLPAESPSEIPSVVKQSRRHGTMDKKRGSCESLQGSVMSPVRGRTRSAICQGSPGRSQWSEKNKEKN